jgi:opacity protein-like surface antigen
MRHVLLASVAAAAIALATAPQAAVAADLAVKAPPIVPVFSWTGVYIGGNLGVGWGRKNWSDPFPAPVFGDRIDIGGAIAGGQIGFNYQVGAAVWGLEADADWANIQGTNTCFAAIGGLNCGAKVRSIGTVAARLGYAVDRTLLYVKGGGAWVNDEYSLNNSGIVAPGAAVIATTTVTKWGWTIGGGIEHALSNNWTMKLEYNYMSFGSNAVTFPFAAPFNTFSIDQRVSLVKLGVNYKFDWGPVVAKY